MIFPLIELVDRYSIAQLKYHKTNGANLQELAFYQQQLLSYDLESISQELDELYEVHASIWNLEAELKAGRESELSLDEIGRRAIRIRDFNNQRMSLKNNMASKLGCVVKEIKQDHLSEPR